MFLKKLVLVFSMALLASGLVKSSEYSSQNNPKTSEDLQAHCDFFPANNLRFPVLASGHMSEMDYKRILQVVYQTYEPIFLKYGFGRFQIENRWTDNTVNAMADIVPAKDSSGGTSPIRMIHMYGGLARHPLMTREGFILVACHEIGHHLGGYPRYDGKGWASNEGESDYFSTSKCARIVFGQMNTHLAWLEHSHVDFQVRVQCNASFSSDVNQAAICMRSSMAGLSLARTLASLNGTPPTVNFASRDASVVAQTYDSHPRAQCRLDTYFQGAICQKSEWDRFGSGPGFGACEARYSARGTRPACWYHDPIPRN